MKKPIYSVIIPYLETVNSKPNTCLDLCIKYLKQNSKYPFEIIPISGYDYYTAVNIGVEKATTEIICPINDDMFVEPNWDDLFVKYSLQDDMNCVSGWYVESGRIPVGGDKIEKDFGRTPESFRYDDFVEYIKNYKKNFNVPEVMDGIVNAAPVFIHKKNWIPFRNNEFDYIYFTDFLPSNGFKMKKVSSFVYHIQSLTAKPNL
jgi:hypothetical protein